MPRGRIIDKRISRSEKFAALRFDRSRVLYLMMLAFTDVEGRVWADPKEVKLDVCPLLKYSERQVAESLVDMYNVGLLRLYSDTKLAVPVAQYEAFHTFNTVRRDQEARSRYSAPPTGKQQDYNGSATVVQQLKVKVKGKGKEDKNGVGVRNSLSIYFDEAERQWRNITTDDLDLWKKAYPHCDIELELLRMADWCLRNWTNSAGGPGKGQKSNWPAFIRNWLAREERRGGTVHYKPGSDQLPPSLAAWVNKKKEDT